MRSPRSRGQQLDLLGQKQRTELDGEALDEILVGEYRSPVRATVGIVVELPEMDELIDGARVGLEVADQLLVLATLLERRVAELGIQLDGLAHLADLKRVGSHFIHRHGDPPESVLVFRSASRVWTGQTSSKRVARQQPAIKDLDRIAGTHEDRAPEEAMKGVVFLGD